MKRPCAALLIVLSACARASTSPAPEITVFAASSLTNAFTELAAAYKDSYDVHADLVFGASNSLARQIIDGAPADVFASADPTSMRDVATFDNARTGQTLATPHFASNRMTIIVERGNPLNIRSIEDLGKAGVILVVCDPAVPCGGYARTVLRKAGTPATAASFEENVKGVVAKVATGEADAGIVYETDAQAAAGDVDRVPIVDLHNIVAAYPIAALSNDGRSSPHARLFVAFTVSSAGQAILRRHGFEPPA